MIRMTLDPQAELFRWSGQWLDVLRDESWELYLAALREAGPLWETFFTGLERYAGSWNPEWSAFGIDFLDAARTLFRPAGRPGGQQWQEAYVRIFRLSFDIYRPGYPDRLFEDMKDAMRATSAHLAAQGASIAWIAGPEALARYFDLCLDSTVLVTIPARGGSKGVPRKALQPVGGVPLIVHTIRAALAVRGVDRVVVNTDDPEIRDVALAHGAEAPFLRPRELAQDDSSLDDVLAWQNQWFRDNGCFIHHIGIVMSPTNPIRGAGLVDRALAVGLADPLIGHIRSVAPAGGRADNLWTIEDGRPRPVLADGPPQGRLVRNTFSFAIDLTQRVVFAYQTPKKVLFLVNNLEGIDIDEPGDLAVARMAFAQGLA